MVYDYRKIFGSAHNIQWAIKAITSRRNGSTHDPKNWPRGRRAGSKARAGSAHSHLEVDVAYLGDLHYIYKFIMCDSRTKKEETILLV